MSESKDFSQEFFTKASIRPRFALTLGALLLGVLVTSSGGSARATSLVNQTALPANCIPQFAVPLPVFGSAGSTARVHALSHNRITITMKEIDQAVLPVGMQSLPSEGCPNPRITFSKTRVWAYETSDSKTGKILGPANSPAVTIEARRGHSVQVTYANQLPSFNSADATGPGLVQGLIAIDQTLHWADPLDTDCGMPINCALPENANNYCCRQYTGPQPAVVHLHGAETATCYDGGPDAWFTPDGGTGRHYCTDDNPGSGKAVYTYENTQEPGTLWFHDHTLGATRNNVYAGLAGFYFLRDPSTEPKKLPTGPYEIELVIQNRTFDTDSQLGFSRLESSNPFDQQNPQAPHLHPFWIATFAGLVLTVNGAAWPYLKVEPRRYRFRLLDGALGARFDLHFGSAPVYQIGADDNYFDRPVLVNATACQGTLPPVCSDVSLLSGERADIIVDFSKLAGQTVTVTNSSTFPDNVMQFQVVLPLKGRDHSCDPAKLDLVNGFCARRTPMVRLTDGKGHLAPGVKIDRVRQFVLPELDEAEGTPDANVEVFVNNTLWNGLLSPSIEADFPSDGVSESPRVGSTELWELVNTDPVFNPVSRLPLPGHPMHTHLVQFQILNRQNFDATDYQAAWDAAFPDSCTHIAGFCPGYGPPLDYLTLNDEGAVGGNPAVGPYLHDSSGNPTPILPPDPGESGWKDTAKSFSQQVLRILLRWTPSDVPVIKDKSYLGQNLYSFDPTKGYYVWHCHIAGHEDNEMMRPYKVTK